jgi:hypothetical protein
MQRCLHCTKTDPAAARLDLASKLRSIPKSKANSCGIAQNLGPIIAELKSIIFIIFYDKNFPFYYGAS